MVPHYQPEYAVKWRKSKQLLAAYIDRYNAGKRLGAQLRSNHKQLAEYLLFLYSAALAREQARGELLTAGQDLPLLSTNNGQLATELGCTNRTIINLRARLKAAGVIRREIFHGTNAQYEIELGAPVVHLQHNGDPHNAIYRFMPGFQPIQQCGHAPASDTDALDIAKSFHHTVSGTPPVTNQLIELGRAEPPPFGDNQSVTPATGVSFGGKAVENHPKAVEKPPTGRKPGTGPGLSTGYETAARPHQDAPPVAARPPKADDTPPEFAPDTVAEALAGRPEAAIRTIRRHLAVIWACVQLNLYPDQWISEAEAERGRARLAEYFTYAHPDGWAGGAAEIIERIMLVRKWIERGRKAGERRWVPLPSHYFDFRNPTGFRATKRWYKSHLRSKAEIKANELLTKAVREYLRSQEPGAVRGPSETYRRIAQRLGNYGCSLLERFHLQIQDHATATTKTGTAEGRQQGPL